MLPEPARTGLPATAARPSVPWGGATAIGSLLISLFVANVGGVILVLLLPGLYHHNTLLFEILAYQFLTLGVISCLIGLILVRFPHILPAVGYCFPGWQALLKAGALAVPLVIAVSLLTALFNHFLPGFQVQGNAKQELLAGMHTPIPTWEEVLVFLWAAVQAPLTEETLFRGIMFQGIRTFCTRWLPYAWSVFLSAVISGFIFGLIHFEIHSLPLLFFVGFVLAYVYQYTRSIYASALVHGIFNAVAVVSVFHVL